MERKLPKIGEPGTFDDLIAIAAINSVEREGIPEDAFEGKPFEPSKRLKRRLNLYFRLYFGKKAIFHPEVDTPFQRMKYYLYAAFKSPKKRKKG